MTVGRIEAAVVDQALKPQRRRRDLAFRTLDPAHHPTGISFIELARFHRIRQLGSSRLQALPTLLQVSGRPPISYLSQYKDGGTITPPKPNTRSTQV